MIPIDTGWETLRKDGVKSFVWKSTDYLGLWTPTWNTVTSRYPIGTNIFERDWDLLVILDSCRVDALQTVADSKQYLNDIKQVKSVGSMTAEWTIKTFTKEFSDTIAETAFVAGNHWAHRIFNEELHSYPEKEHIRTYDMLREGNPRWTPVSSDDFGHFEPVFATGNQNDPLHPELNRIPHIVTDRAIAVGRNQDYDRLIVHYQLPHMKFIAGALDWEAGKTSMETLMEGPEPTRNLLPEEESWRPAKRGEVSIETMRQLHIKNLRLALDYVDVLLQNVDANTVVISADHGEGLGDSGVWGHPYACPLPPIKNVPWATTTATDERTYQSKHDSLDRMPEEEERMEFLKQMGYL